MSSSRSDASHAPANEHQLLAELDRLEDLIEDMDDLGISSRDEAEARRLALHRQLDALEGAE